MVRFESSCGSEFDAVIAVSKQDQNTFRKNYGWEHVEAIDTAVDLGEACIGKSGSEPVGFTLIFDSRVLVDGLHLLRFEAQYPNGTSATTATEVFLENDPPYEAGGD